MPYQPGDILLDKYRIESLIGEGSYGETYRATHLELGVSRAIKILRKDASGLGTAAGTTRGMDAATFTSIGNSIADLLISATATGMPDPGVIEQVKARVESVCQQHPTYTV